MIRAGNSDGDSISERCVLQLWWTAKDEPVRNKSLRIPKQLSVRAIWSRDRAGGNTNASAAGSRHASNLVCPFNGEEDEGKKQFISFVSMLDA